MKIAFVANTCWNIYNFRRGLVQNFLSKGDEVLVLAPTDAYTREVRDWGVKFIDTLLEGTGANPLKDLSYLRTLFRVFKKEKPDIVLSYTIKANIYASLAGKPTSTPVICNVSGLGTVFLVKGLAGKVAMMLYKIAFRYSKYIFFQNEDDKSMFVSYVKVEDKKTGILPGSGIDLQRFLPTPLKETGTTSFLMIARVIIEKGVREYAEAASYFKENDEVKFSLIGEFDEGHARSIDKEELNAWIESGSITYFDHSNDIVKIIEEHDVVVLPSYREGTPRTLLEGAALGRPLITTNVPGCKEVVKDGFNGFLCEAKSAKSLLAKFQLFLSLNEQEKNQLAANSRTLVEQAYDERIVIGMYDDVIRRIIP